MGHHLHVDMVHIPSIVVLDFTCGGWRMVLKVI